jgi:hypothetical protein
MKKTTKILVLFFIIYGAMVFSQEKYFTKTAYGGISYLKGDRIVLNFKGKNKKQLLSLVKKYCDEAKFKIRKETSDFVVYRDFSTICTKDKCFSDLISKSIITAAVFDGKVELYLNYTIYTSLFDAKLLINDNDDVASENDVPFSEYSFENKWTDATGLDAVYPECVFDAKGVLKNPIVKAKIEEYYDFYGNDLSQYILKR